MCRRVLTESDHEAGVDLVGAMLRCVALDAEVRSQVALAYLVQVVARKRLENLDSQASDTWEGQKEIEGQKFAYANAGNAIGSRGAVIPRILPTVRTALFGGVGRAIARPKPCKNQVLLACGANGRRWQWIGPDHGASCGLARYQGAVQCAH